MIALDVVIDNEAAISSSLAGLASQVPFAAAKTINLTLQDAQATIRDHLPGEFTLRRSDFINKTIYIGRGDFATKANLVGTVRVNPERNFLAKFEDGGHKTSVSGKALAVPIMRFNGAPNLIIQRGDALSVKRLMATIQNSQGRVLKASVRKGQLRVKQVGGSVFLLKTPKGTLIMQHPESGPDRVGNRSNLKVLYAFERDVPIPPDLHFEEIAMATALANWPTHAEEAIDIAIATMR